MFFLKCATYCIVFTTYLYIDVFWIRGISCLDTICLFYMNIFIILKILFKFPFYKLHSSVTRVTDTPAGVVQSRAEAVWRRPRNCCLLRAGWRSQDGPLSCAVSRHWEPYQEHYSFCHQSWLRLPLPSTPDHSRPHSFLQSPCRTTRLNPATQLTKQLSRAHHTLSLWATWCRPLLAVVGQLGTFTDFREESY